jgi:type I restriction enzyme M protein
MASSATDSQGKDKNIREDLIKTGSVDVMISVANNFFYTKSLPCSLWFFDKAKAESIRDKVLFIDARNYYTVVDRTLNEWTDWQLKNINAIVWLYRGEIEKYKELVRDYHIELMTQAAFIHDNKTHEKMALGASFAETLQSFEAFKADQQELAKFDMEKIIRKDKKKRQAEWDQQLKAIDDVIDTAKEAVWLYEKFGEGEYRDIPGLCKIADLSEIEGKNWSLTPGAYVGVAPVEDDGVDFNERMKEIHAELLKLQAESNTLMQTISDNMKELGL